jgi:hypothetical protein
MSRISIVPYLLAVMLAISTCTSENKQQSQVTFGSAPAASGEYGSRSGGLVVKGKDIRVEVDIKHDSSLMRSFAYGAHVNDPATSGSKAAFVGSGKSASDMIRPISFSADADYPEMLSGYLSHIDPGGQTTMIDFYEDGHGCETDVVTRRGTDGTLRTYIVDSTGWVDNMLDEAGKKSERHCTR